MKRTGNLWDKIISKENLYIAYRKARRGKAWQKKVKRIDDRTSYFLGKLHNILADGRYHTSSYKTKVIYEPKMRTIYILPFYPDRIIHHAIMNVLEPIWDKLFIEHSYACRLGKGQHKGSKYCMSLVRKYKYCLKCDISKFYPSINHQIMKTIIRKKIKDERLLKLLDEIIDSIEGNTNVPIGNYLSQWFGNLYLNELDMLIKHHYHFKAYLRYCDDFLLFSDDKEELHKIAAELKVFLADKLKLKMSKCDVFPTTRGVDFLGYRHFPQGYILVRKATAKRMKKRMRGVLWNYKHHKITKIQALSQIASTEGWLKHANTYNFSVSLQLDKLKECITNERFSKTS